ncbi:MAG: HAD family hydrolase [Halobacteriaceae archaeon]
MTADRVVYFDLDGTLVTYDRSFRAIFEDGVHPVGDDVYDVYTTALFDAIDEAASTPYRDAFTTTVEQTDLAGDPESLAAAYIDAEVAAATAVEGARSVLETATDQGPVGVLTNGAGPVQRRKLAALDLTTHVDVVVASGEAGHRKPAADLFAIAEDRLSGDDYVYVCDDPVADVGGATGVGWTTILVGATPEADEPPSTETVDSLTAVGDHL